MDPFIEDRGLWPDFHDDLIAEIKHSLAVRLPERYFVQTAERAYVVLAGTDQKEAKPIYRDVRSELPIPASRPSKSGSVALRAFIDEHFRENFIEIYEAEPSPRLVTCIEVLSPSNKRRGTKGWRLYLRKRNALMLGKANLVEIDLVRGGRRMPMVESWPDSPYYLLVGREDHVPYCRVWPVQFNQPLPDISVPLARPDPDLSLALQPMIDAIYERSRYALRLDYNRPPAIALSPEENAWLAARLHSEQTPAKSPATPKRPRRRR
jgi:hypothetical protein